MTMESRPGTTAGEAGREAPRPAPAAAGPRSGTIAWSRTAFGWAVNLDGTDAAAAFTLPRLEVHQSAQGWRSLCLRGDGTRSDRLGRPGDSVQVARAAAEAAWRERT